jgi:ATP-dependent DNA ligase
MEERFRIKIDGIVRDLNAQFNIPLEAQLRPQKGVSFYDLKPEEQQRILGSPDWIAEPKYDGARALMYITQKGSFLLSSRISKKTGAYSDVTDHFPQLMVDPALVGGDVVLDGELYLPQMAVSKKFWTGEGATDSTLNAVVALMNASASRARQLQEQNRMSAHYFVFDILKYGCLDLRSKPLKERDARRFVVVTKLTLANPYIHSVPFEFASLGSAQERFAKLGFEGAMLKDLNSPYYAPSIGARNKGWVKWKKMESHDGFITGYLPGRAGFKGLVGALLISAMKEGGGTFEFAAVSNIPLVERRAMSNPDGSLKREFYDRVVEIRAQTMTRTSRLRHATLLRWRPEKSPVECFYQVKLDARVHSAKSSSHRTGC